MPVRLKKLHLSLTYALRSGSMPILKVITARVLLETAGFPGAEIDRLPVARPEKQRHWSLCTPIGETDADVAELAF